MTSNRRSTSILRAIIQKNRHQALTFWRIIKYGVANFSRNAWLSLAATAIMIVTLAIISITVIARNVMVDTVASIEDKITMSIYIKQDVKYTDIQQIKSDIESMPDVKSVVYVSPEEAAADFSKINSDNLDMLTALGEATNQMPGIFNIQVVDINNTANLENYVSTNALMKKSLNLSWEPSFATNRREAIDNIARTMSFIEKVGLFAGITFVIIASLIIFNTIRMAIFNRREEIYMMKLIGADKSFIRGPFIVEAILYGVVASAVTIGLVLGGLFLISPKLLEYGVILQPTTDIITSYWPLIALGLILIGTLIGVTSAMLATRKYLRLRD